MNEKPYLTLTSKNFPSPRTAELGDSLILNDNLEQDLSWYPFEEVHKGTLLKLSSTIVFFVCLSGNVRITKNLAHYRLHDGDVIISASGQFGIVDEFDRHTKFFFIVMNENFYYPILLTFETNIFQNIINNHPVCHMPEYRQRELLGIYTAIKGHINDLHDDPLLTDIVRSYMQAFFFNFYSELVISGNKEGMKEVNKEYDRKQEIFNKYIDLLQKNYVTEHKINFYADKLCVTPRWLSRVVKEVSGQYASELINQFLINEAKQLLRTKKYTVNQICDMLNFSTQQMFTRFFKNMTGNTPKQYMELQ